MRDAKRLRKKARRVFLEANEAELHGQSEYADRLRFARDSSRTTPLL
jgi:hypothetical protein